MFLAKVGQPGQEPGLACGLLGQQRGGLHECGDFLCAQRDAAKQLSIFAIQPSHRNPGHRAAVLNVFIAAQPARMAMVVHCTNYAKVMQGILKKLRLRRNPRAGRRVQAYCRVCAPALSRTG